MGGSNLFAELHNWLTDFTITISLTVKNCSRKTELVHTFSKLAGLFYCDKKYGNINSPTRVNDFHSTYK